MPERRERGRGIEWADVRAVLDDFGIKYELDAHGFTVRAPVMLRFRNPDDDWRLRCGSGIAGRGGTWRIVQVTTGDALSRQVATVAELRRILREHLAGPVPDPQHPERYYACKHHTRFTSGHYTWKIKRYAAPGEK